MADLEQLKQKLASETDESQFLLEQRTVVQLLQNMAGYTDLIPFASNPDNDDEKWSRFWFSKTKTDTLDKLPVIAKLAAIYKERSKAERTLPVQQSFLLALLYLLETPKALINTLPARQRALYYRDLLGFTRRGSQPDNVAVNFTLQKESASYLLPAGTLLDAGQDSAGNSITYLTDDNLLITHQQLAKLSWMQKDSDGNWQFYTALDQEQNIALPDAGIRLFSVTENVTTPQTALSFDVPLAALAGELQIVPVWPEESRSATRASLTFSLVGDSQTLTFQPDDTSTPAIYTLPAEQSEQARRKHPASWKTPALSVHYLPGPEVTLPLALDVTLVDCPQLGYVAQDGQGALHGISFPFGAQPAVGNAFELTLPALFLQTGGEFTLEPQWLNLPTENFADWYEDYAAPPADNGAFKAHIALISAQGERLQEVELPLFTGTGAPQPAPLTITLPAQSAGEDLRIRVELSGKDFLHAAWQADTAGGEKNPPWTPQVSEVHTRFQQRLTLSARQANRLQPYADALASEQALYLGFSEVTPGEILSLYWSLNSPSALALSWFYWSQDETWKSLAAGLQDSTLDLSASGLWQAVLPADAVAGGGDSSELADSCYWLRAVSASTNEILPDEAPRLNALFANAVTASLNTATPVDDSHFADPLPANTISQLVSPVTQISSVSQPLPSSGGKVAETEKAMFARAATRIAHRQRAITWGDMRNLLKENYPQIFDVKFPDVNKLNQIPALEKQQLLVIPESRFRDNDDALRPMLSAGRLLSMTAWLAQYTSLWAKPELMNPTYIDVKATYEVVFIAGVNESYGYQQLHHYLQQLYIPWQENQQQAVTPGNQIDYFLLLARLRQAPLVAQVNDLKIQRVDEQDPNDDGHHNIQASDTEVLILIPQINAPAA